MMKKLLSLMLVVCMAMGIGIVPVSAGAPVVFDGDTKVMFDQSFGGLSGAADAPDFTISGSGWNYTDYFMIADGGERSIISKESYDVSDAAQWTFTSKQSCTYHGYNIKLAYDEANSKGYVLTYSRAAKKLALFRDTGYGYAEAKVAKAVATAGIDAYNTDVTITVTYTKATNTLKVSNSRNSNIIEYTPTDGYEPSLNGKFGIEGTSAGIFTVFNMSLVKSYDSVTVDQWRYDKTFTAANTQAELEADGFTFSKATTPSDSGLYFNGKEFTFGPNGKAVSGDYYFETKLKRQYNSYTLDFNKSDNGYYRIWYGVNDDSSAKNKPWIKLIKYDASTSTTHDLVVINKESGLSAGHTRIYKGTVKTLNDGSVDINIGIYNGSTLEYTLAYTDTATDTVEGTITTETPVLDENGDPTYDEDGNAITETITTTGEVDTGAPLTSGKLRLDSNGTGTSYMYYLKMYSLGEVTEGTPVTYSNPVIDKTFSSADTTDSIKTEGFSTSLSSNVTVSFADSYLKFSGKNNTLIYTNADATDGTYSFSTQFKHGNNYARVYFNYVDSSNYYALWADSYNSPKVLTLRKVCNGTTYILGSVSLGSSSASAAGRVKTTADVTVTNKDDGSIGITAKWSNSYLTHEFTYTDTSTDMIDTDDDGVADADTGAPITSGAIRVYQGYSASYVYSFKLTKYETVMEGASDGTPVFEGKFTTDTGAIKEITKGDICFEYPTALLGKYTVVAALYEDYKMTGLKTFKPLDLYTGKISLFDTTNSTAENMKVRVYFLDSGETLKLVADEVYELK